MATRLASVPTRHRACAHVVLPRCPDPAQHVRRTRSPSRHTKRLLHEQSYPPNDEYRSFPVVRNAPESHGQRCWGPLLGEEKRGKSDSWVRFLVEQCATPEADWAFPPSGRSETPRREEVSSSRSRKAEERDNPSETTLMVQAESRSMDGVGQRGLWSQGFLLASVQTSLEA